MVFSQGVRQYVEHAKQAGVDGLLTLDLPPEEAEELVGASRELGMKNVFIVAPTTPASRISNCRIFIRVLFIMSLVKVLQELEMILR